jgi:hypothetical protein
MLTQLSESPSLELIETKVGVIRKTAHATYNDSYCPRERERERESERKREKLSQEKLVEHFSTLGEEYLALCRCVYYGEFCIF